MQTLTDEPLQVGLVSPRCLRRDVDAELFSNISDVMGFQPVSPVAASVCVPSTLLLKPFFLGFFGFLPLFFSLRVVRYLLGKRLFILQPGTTVSARLFLFFSVLLLDNISSASKFGSRVPAVPGTPQSQVPP